MENIKIQMDTRMQWKAACGQLLNEGFIISAYEFGSDRAPLHQFWIEVHDSRYGEELSQERIDKLVVDLFLWEV